MSPIIICDCGPLSLAVGDRNAAAYFEPDEPWSVISISNPGMTPVEFKSPYVINVLHLQFDDYVKVQPGATLFSDSMSIAVWNFIDTTIKKNFFLHCLMGLSRSPAIAAALCDVYGAESRMWYSGGRQPNKRVYGLLLREARNRGRLTKERYLELMASHQ